jgi:hypothetical protein
VVRVRTPGLPGPRCELRRIYGGLLQTPATQPLKQNQEKKPIWVVRILIAERQFTADNAYTGIECVCTVHSSIDGSVNTCPIIQTGTIVRGSRP